MIIEDKDIDLTSDIGNDDTDITGVRNDVQPNQQQAQEPGQETKQEEKSVRQLLEEAAAVVTDDQGRVRDPETGQFARKPKDGEEGKEQQAATEGVQQPQQQQPTDLSQVKLPDELANVIQALPEANRPAVHSALAAREAAWQSFAQRVEGHVNGYAEIEKVLAPRREAWALQGATPPQALNQLLALSDFATRDPKGFVTWFAGNNNIDLSEVSEEYVPPDPTIAALQSQVGQLTGTIQHLLNGNAVQNNRQYLDAVTSFETAADEKGQPLHPHFGNVANEMLALVPHIRQANPGLSSDQVLKQAYDQAVYANPSTRQLVLAAEEARRTAARTAEIASKRVAGQGLTGNAPAGEGVQANAIPNDTVRGALEAAIALHS
jgi:hypothetical protein